MLDFIQFINDNAVALTLQQKIDLLNDFVEQYNYQEMIDDGEGSLIPNPMSKAEFANLTIKRYFEESVDAVRARRAREAVSWDGLVLE